VIVALVGSSEAHTFYGRLHGTPTSGMHGQLIFH
jgi:hypothetical protein